MLNEVIESTFVNYLQAFRDEENGFFLFQREVLEHILYILQEVIDVWSANAKKGILKALIHKDIFQFSQMST